MYVDITSVTYNKKENSFVIIGTDLDQILLSDWAQEFSDAAEVTFKFDLNGKGPRLYLFKLIKSQVKEDHKSLLEMASALQGHITNISSNFIVQAEE